MKTKLHYVFSISIFLIVFSLQAQNSLWQATKRVAVSKTVSNLNLDASKVDYMVLNTKMLDKALKTSKGGLNKLNSRLIEIPIKNGKLQTFTLHETAVFSPSLAAKFPNIKSYKGIAVDGSGAQLTMSVSPDGIHTMINNLNNDNLFMQPLEKGGNEYVIYSRKNRLKKGQSFRCSTLEAIKTSTSKTNARKILDEGGANNQRLQRFRIAISVTGEYTAFHGGTISGALAAINTSMARINAIFETDMAVTFEVVDATELIYTDANLDPYSNPGVGTSSNNFNSIEGWSLQLQNNLTSTIGNSAYDIGHLFGDDGGGGFAGCIGCVCDDDNPNDDFDRNKGSGYTSPPDGIPEGDVFDLNFLVHEIGHQMGGNHTWSFEPEGTTVQAEPGSGTTLMAYAGIAGEDNVASDSDPYFHHLSIKQILNTIATKDCQTIEDIPNLPPNAMAGNNFVIPASTPYILKGNAVDANPDDILTYCWEQIDIGVVNNTNFGPNLQDGSMNRSVLPTTSPNRYIPRLSSVLSNRVIQTNPGLGSDWETASSISRTLNWALTVRDRNLQGNTVGQSSYDTMSISVVAGSTQNPVGPFSVTSQAEMNSSWRQNTFETITWNVAGTNANGINTSSVNILLSTDGGVNFDTILVSNTPNDGTENIRVPDLEATNCRIMVEPVGNIYYAINSADFAIGFEVNEVCEQQFVSGNNLNIAINDGQTITNSINVPVSNILSSIKVNVDVTHTFISDLNVTLQHPNGSTTTNLWSENCFVSSGFRDFDIIFDDDGESVNCASPTIGTYIPSTPLSVFEGLDMQGNWTLSILDGAEGDVGRLNNWYVEFCTVSFERINFVDTFTGFSVFPNPNNGIFILKLNTENTQRMLDLNVFDIRGRRVYNELFNGGSRIEKTIDLNGFKAGVYFLNLNDSDQTYTYKVVIR